MRALAFVFLVGCAAEPCTAHLQAGVDAVWCREAPPELVVDDTSPCALAVVHHAAEFWVPLGALDVRTGPVPPVGHERTGTIYLTVGDVPGTASGTTAWHRVDGIQQWARITVEHCDDLQDVAHELGHAWGAGHSPDARDLMHFQPDRITGWDVPAVLLTAYEASR